MRQIKTLESDGKRLCLLGIMKVGVDFMRAYVSCWVTGGDVCATLEQHTINDAIAHFSRN